MIFDFLQALSRVDDGMRSWLGEDLVHGQTLILYLLIEKGDATPSRLAEEMNLSRGRMSHLLDDMEGDDLLTRKPDPEDGRGYLVQLTPKGRGQAKRARDLVVGLEAALLESLGQAGCAMLLEQLGRVASLRAPGPDSATGPAPEEK